MKREKWSEEETGGTILPEGVDRKNTRLIVDGVSE